MRSGVAETVLGILFYALILAFLLPVASIHRQSYLGLCAAASELFVIVVPMILVAIMVRSDLSWPARVLRWHFIACTCILVLSIVTLFVHWLGYPGPASF